MHTVLFRTFISRAYWYALTALALAPYLQYGYLGLSKTWFAVGELSKAKDMLILAMEHNNYSDNHAIYKAKLHTLSQNQTLNIEVK